MTLFLWQTLVLFKMPYIPTSKYISTFSDQDKAKHANEFQTDFISQFFVTMNYDFRIGICGKLFIPYSKFFPKFLVVIDFTIDYNKTVI